MNKSELISAVASAAGLSKADSKKALEAIIKTTQDCLAKGEKVTLVGFGTFSVNEKKARKGRNPHTGKPINIAAKKVAKFKVGAMLAEAVQ